MPDQREWSSHRWNPVRTVNRALYLIFACLVVFAVYHALPPSHITIETGPVNGSYYDDALKYKQELQSQGIAVTLQPNPDSVDIIDRVAVATGQVRIGFVAQRVNRADFPDVRSLGAIELQPLFIFYSTGMGQIATPDDLRGRRIVMPTQLSATSEASLRLLRHYDVTPENTSITFLPIAKAAAALGAGQFDAGFFMLAPRNAFITRLAANRKLRLLSLGDVVALSRIDPYVRPVVLPHRVYDVESDIPPEDIHMLAAPVNVVVREDTPPAILYPLMQAMADVHQGATLINNAGEFPNLINISLPADPLATQFQKSGTPWIYRNLPLWMASLIDSYFVLGLALVVIIEVYRGFHYLTELVDFLFVNLWLWILMRIERRSRGGQRLTAIERKLVDLAESTLSRTDKHRRSEELIGHIRRTMR
jgi:TRAP-type uncharacterized transport system substrate-binding protein